jgi:hypothetical protein
LDERLRLDDDQSLPPIETPRQSEHRQSRHSFDAAAVHFSFFEERELLPEKQILGDPRRTP